MYWFALLIAGVLEPVWAHALALASYKPRGERRGALLIFISATSLSVILLAFAMSGLPTGTAYVVWVGTGTALTVVWSLIRKLEKATLPRMFCLVGIVASIIGLNLVT